MPIIRNLYTHRQELAPPVEYENILWKFSVSRHPSSDQYNLYLELTPIEQNETLEYDAVLKLSTPGDKWNVSRRQKFRMYGNSAVIATTTILELHNSKIEISVKKSVVVGLPERFITKIPNITDAQLLVGDEIFNVCKKILAQKSTWFYDLFYGEGSIPNQVIYNVSNVDSQVFRNFLQLLHNHKTLIPPERFREVAQLANKFGAAQCARECEKLLIINNKISPSRKLELATGLSYDVLRDFVLRPLKTREEVENMMGCFDSYTDAKKMDRINEIIGNRNEEPLGVECVSLENSMKYDIGGVPFNVSCSENMVTIDCNWQDISNPWKCEVLLDFGADQHLVELTRTFYFDYLNPRLTFKKFTPNLGIMVNYLVGTFLNVSIDFKVPRSHLTDIVLLAGYEEFHVSKQILAHVSSEFEKIFYSEHVGKDSIQLDDDVEPSELNELLGHIYFPEKTVSEQTIEGLLYLSRKYLITHIDKKCERIFLEENTVNEVMKIELVEMYFPDLFTSLIGRFKSFKDLEALSKIDGFKNLSREIIGAITYSIINSSDASDPENDRRP